MEEPNQDLTDIETAITTAMTSPVHNLNPDQRLERASQIQSLKTRLAALSAQACSHILEADTHGTVRSTITKLAIKTGHDPASSRQELKLNQWLIDYADFRDAFHTGNLSLEHLKQLRKLDTITTRHRLIQDQADFLKAAASLPFTEFKIVVAYWLNAMDPDGKEPSLAEARSGCSYRQHTNGSISGKFYLDPVSAGAFKTVFDAQCQALFRSDTEDQITRTPWQRGAAALLMLLAAGHEHAGRATITPLISIVMGHELARNTLERLMDPTIEPLEPDHSNINRRCEMIDGTPIHPTQAVMALILARYQRIILTAKGRNVEASLQSRGFPAWMRHILLIKSRGRCQTPGCDSPPPWLEADHIKAFSRGGPTALSNGQMLCGPHNQAKEAS